MTFMCRQTVTFVCMVQIFPRLSAIKHIRYKNAASTRYEFEQHIQETSLLLSKFFG